MLAISTYIKRGIMLKERREKLVSREAVKKKEKVWYPGKKA